MAFGIAWYAIFSQRCVIGKLDFMVDYQLIQIGSDQNIIYSYLIQFKYLGCNVEISTMVSLSDLV